MRLILAVALFLLDTALPSAHQSRDLFVAKQAGEGRRLALVIGNDGYTRSPLANARNDARSVAAALRKLSFDVTVIEDGSRMTMGSSMLAFSRRLTSSDLAVIFYAGHGAQVDGTNYLIPVEFDGRSEDEVRMNGVSSDEATRALSRARVGVLILDACRDNPFSGQRSGSRGLAQLEAQGLLVAFSTGAGQTAGDGGGTNSVFTTELLRVLGAPGRGLRDTFFEVQRRVQASTRGSQFPAVYSQLTDDVVLTPGVTAAPSGVASELDSKALALRVELELWDAIKGASDATLFEDYLKRYPNGQFRSVADDRIRRARAAVEPPPAPPSVNNTSSAAPPSRPPALRVVFENAFVRVMLNSVTTSDGVQVNLSIENSSNSAVRISSPACLRWEVVDEKGVFGRLISSPGLPHQQCAEGGINTGQPIDAERFIDLIPGEPTTISLRFRIYGGGRPAPPVTVTGELIRSGSRGTGTFAVVLPNLR